MYLTLAYEAGIGVQVAGDVTLIFHDSSLLVLRVCIYILEAKKNLISVSSVCKLNYSFVFILFYFIINMFS